MSATNSEDQANMSDHGNGAAAGPDKAVWDEMAVGEMYYGLAIIRGTFTNEEATKVEQYMRGKGYTFTAKQLQGKHKKLREKNAKLATAENRQAAAANGNGAEAKPKATRKPRAKAAPKTDETGNPITKVKAGTKPRKTATKKEPTVDANEDEGEADSPPPSKKRKAVGAKAGKKVIHQTVKNEKNAEEEDYAPEGERNASMMDFDHSSAAGSESNGLSDDAAAAQKTEVRAETDAQKTVADANADAASEEYNDAPEGHFAEEMVLVQAAKADVDAEDEGSDSNARLHCKDVHIEAYVVQTSA